MQIFDVKLQVTNPKYFFRVTNSTLQNIKFHFMHIAQSKVPEHEGSILPSSFYG